MTDPIVYLGAPSEDGWQGTNQVNSVRAESLTSAVPDPKVFRPYVYRGTGEDQHPTWTVDPPPERKKRAHDPAKIRAANIKRAAKYPTPKRRGFKWRAGGYWYGRVYGPRMEDGSFTPWPAAPPPVVRIAPAPRAPRDPRLTGADIERILAEI